MYRQQCSKPVTLDELTLLSGLSVMLHHCVSEMNQPLSTNSFNPGLAMI